VLLLQYFVTLYTSEPLRQQEEWRPLVKSMQLMAHCHHEDDAQLCAHAAAAASTAVFAAALCDTSPHATAAG
jgi:hypothetical protein